MQKRKNIRLKDYDYSTNGLYFITICTKDRKKILSKINVGVAPLGDPKIQLYNKGKIIKKYIENINKQQNTGIIQYIIMPNHVHFILEININGSPKGATPTVPKIINSFKSLVTKEIGYSIWQRNYYEHIIRNEKELLKIYEYVQYNHYKWKDDIYNI